MCVDQRGLEQEVIFERSQFSLGDHIDLEELLNSSL